jgi:hypothetical protein
MAGYSGTPLAKKLGIKEGAKVALLTAPENFDEALDGLPQRVAIQRDPRGSGSFDVILLFVNTAAALRNRFGHAATRLVENGGLWIAWPKKALGIVTDVDENIVRRFGIESGLVDNKVCAIDDTWSGLRFVIRVKDRKPKRI